MKSRNISKSLIGGDLYIYGNYNKREDYSANLKIKNFKIDKNSKLYDLISASRFIDIYSQIKNEKDQLKYLEVSLKKENETLKIINGFTSGGMVGYTFAGEAIPSRKKSNIQGFYGPIYIFDKIFNKIPLLNKILSNDPNDSLIGAEFFINTNREETELIINPLSLATPGVFRKIFDIFDFNNSLDTVEIDNEPR